MTDQRTQTEGGIAAQLQSGEEAPDFWLPSTQGSEVSLSQYRGLKHVLLVFLRGMTCPFCRRHVSQLRLGYPKFREKEAEVIVITSTPPDRAQQYQNLFHFEHPYLCDPERETASRYGLRAAKRSVIGGAVRSGTFWKGLATMPTDMHTYPSVKELQALGTGQVDGFFLIDKGGIAREAKVGALLTLLPKNEEIERMLGELSGSNGSTHGVG
jgi:peroxiredoxin